jgi:hypothetical protein
VIRKYLLKRILPFAVTSVLGKLLLILLTSGQGISINLTPITMSVSFAEINSPYLSPASSTPLQIIEAPSPGLDAGLVDFEFFGMAILAVTFEANGEVSTIKVTKPVRNEMHKADLATYESLTNAAIASARLIKFIPARKNGQNITLQVSIAYRFGCREGSNICFSGYGEPYLKRGKDYVSLKAGTEISF